MSVARHAQRSVAVGAAFLLVAHLAGAAGAARRALVVLALYGFVLHVVLGKAYSLVPSYFERELATPRLPAAQVPLTAVGAALLAADAVPSAPLPGAVPVAAVGATLWTAGLALGVGALAYSVRTNPTGAATATADHEADRRGVDRVANAAVPVALAYLLAGGYATLAPAVGLPPLVDGYPPRASHLLAAGGAALVLFAVGFRLLPRFAAADTPRGVHLAVLPAGAVAPAGLAWGVGGGPVLLAAGVLESVALVGFAALTVALLVRSERDRVGLYGPALGGVAGVAAAALGLHMAVAGVAPGFAGAHLRLTLLGLLGLSVVGVAYQFYPPAVGSRPGAADRTAAASLALLAAGVAVPAAGLVGGWPAALVGGHLLGAAGAALFGYLVVGLLVERGDL
jgi:hypothetical protein